MIPKSHRLKGEKNFELLAKTGRRVQCGPITLVYKRIALSQPTQVGLVVNTKINKRAAVRNSIKRRLRVVFREAIDKAIISKDNYQFMVLVKPSIIGLSTDELRKSIWPCLPRTQAFEENIRSKANQ